MCLIFMILIGYAGLMVSLLRQFQLFKPLCAVDNVLQHFENWCFCAKCDAPILPILGLLQEVPVPECIYYTVSRFCVLRVMYQNK